MILLGVQQPETCEQNAGCTHPLPFLGLSLQCYKLGCSKCRYSPNGCTKCRAERDEKIKVFIILGKGAHLSKLPHAAIQTEGKA